jgi:hypothetical protein
MPTDPVEAWENEGGALSPSAQKEARLARLFKDVKPPEIAGLDLRGMSPLEIIRLLPRYGGRNPVCAILIDNRTGKAYGLRSGWVREATEFSGIVFQKGNISPEVAGNAGLVWRELGNHVEAQAAASMRSAGTTDADLYINAGNPCYQRGLGCYYRLPEMLAEGSQLNVINKSGIRFSFTGLSD